MGTTMSVISSVLLSIPRWSQLIGVLEEILDVPGNPVFVVRQGAKEILIPAAKELVSAVDVATGTMTVRLIDGLGE